ncbi:hypothetical protein [Synechococcus phage MinM1]|nr:hypothetical protein [Synechococcus phage MinM1]
MTAIVTGADGRPYMHRTAREEVFVAEMPRASSDPRATPHTGHALLVAWLDPVRPSDHPRAMVRCPDGRLLQVDAGAVCAADNLAGRRLGPAGPQARRFA